MLRKFKVSNFKSFEKDFVLDLSNVNGYSFNNECIKNSLVNAGIIYGYNGMGKSNLGFALFDIVEHLTDKNRDEIPYGNYLNAYSNETEADFYYEFLIEGAIVKYHYKKSDYKTLVFEELCIDGHEIISFDRTAGDTFSVSLLGTENLNKVITDNKISVVKYVKNNTSLDLENYECLVFAEFYKFVDRMLFFRSLLHDLTYIGNDTGTTSLIDYIIAKDKVADFESFLHEANVDCKLKTVSLPNRQTIAFDFDGKLIPMLDVVSTGTKALLLFYFWYLRIIDQKVSFLFIDEFDAFYHHELSELIVKKLKESGIQFILTTHNISIMSNDLLRPDCYFLMNKRVIKSLAKCTFKELREAHNIEKMYKAGAFDVEG